METLQELLTNRRFRAHLRQAAAVTVETGHEAGFGIWMKGSRISLGEVIEGGCAEIVLEALDLPQGLLHIHPFPEGAIIPAGDDLEGLSLPSQAPVQWEIIGQVDWRGEVSLLFLEPVRPIAVSDILLWEEETEELQQLGASQEVVNEKLTALGLKVSMSTIRYRLKSAV